MGTPLLQITAEKFTNLERNGVEEHCEEPVDTDRRQFDVDAVQMTTDVWQLHADQLLQDLLVGARTDQRLVEVVR